MFEWVLCPLAYRIFTVCSVCFRGSWLLLLVCRCVPWACHNWPCAMDLPWAPTVRCGGQPIALDFGLCVDGVCECHPRTRRYSFLLHLSGANTQPSAFAMPWKSVTEPLSCWTECFCSSMLSRTSGTLQPCRLTSTSTSNNNRPILVSHFMWVFIILCPCWKDQTPVRAVAYTYVHHQRLW